MRVKVGDKVYDGEVQPVMVLLTKEERDEIAGMRLGATKYCVYPATEEWNENDRAKIKAWIEVPYES